jgi:hypothetical protein
MPDKNWTLSPSDFAFLWEECKRCFYLKIVSDFRRPGGPMPKIFNVIDGQMKFHFSGKRTSDVLPALPNGILDPCGSWVQSTPLAIPRYASTCVIRGKLDSVVRFDDGTYAVIDFKTSAIKPENASLYGRQLHAYALALENAAPGKFALKPITRLGLVVFEPQSFSGSHDTPASLTGELGWIEAPRNDAAFLDFLGEVVDVLEQSNAPAASPACEWCQYRDASRRNGL